MARIYRLDHVSLPVRDLTTSLHFYQSMFGFTVIPIEPDHPTIRWLSISGLNALHLTQGDISGLRLEKTVHFALRIGDLDAFAADLASRGVPFSDWPGRLGQIGHAPGGYRQIFVQDPDGYWIEINDHAGGA
jgi:catechol 2,3-dioxygenase-like lactoylglutathione lyase family enzyme